MDLNQIKADHTRPKIALFGSFGTRNLGNEATLRAMIYNLLEHEPNAEIKCICPEPENAAAEHKISAVPIRAPFPLWKAPRASGNEDRREAGSEGNAPKIAPEKRGLSKALAKFRALLRTCAFPLLEAYRWFKGIAELKGTNSLVMTGTGMLGDYALEPFGLHYDIFRWAVIAKLCRCKLLFVSVGGGHKQHPLSKWFLKAALALADYRSYRDSASKEYLAAMGVDVKNDAVYPDLAFSLSPPAVSTNSDRNSQGTVIGVGVMNYHNRRGVSGNDDTIYRDYLGRVASFVGRLIKSGYTVRVLIGDVTWDQEARHDLRAILEERGLRYEDGRIIDDPASSIDQLLSQLSSVDIVVSSRFHNLLLGVLLGKPAVAISYHEKFQPLMDGVGLGSFCQDIEHIDVDDLIGKVAKLQEVGPSIKVQISRQTENYRAALRQQYERILEVSRPVTNNLGIAEHVTSNS